MNNKNIAYLYLGGIASKKMDDLRNKINNISSREFGEKSIKKYDIINALVTVGLKHQDEVLDNLPLNKEVLEKVKKEVKNDI
jgi:hypothetical protein